MSYKESLFFINTLILIFILIVFSHLSLSKRNNYQINISFANNKSNFLSDSLVNKLLIQKIIKPYKQKNLKLDLKKIELFLESLPEVQNAEVFSYVDGNLYAVIYENIAILRVQQEGFYLDFFGNKIPFSTNYTPKVPIFSGPLGDKKTLELVHLSKFITRDNYLKNEFVEIWNEKYGFTIRLRNYNFEIFWGKSNNNKKKINKLKAFCAYLSENKIDKKLKRIDLTVNNQIVSTY